MKSCLWLEQRGAWRPSVIVIVFLLATAPAWPLVWDAFATIEAASVERPFDVATLHSVFVAVQVGALSLAIGWPLGTMVGLYRFPLRRTLLAVVALPLLVPSFLLAIGWSAFATRVGAGAPWLASGMPGCIVVFSSVGAPLVLFASVAVTSFLTSSQIHAARLAGGEKTLIGHCCRYSFPASAAAATLAAALTISDPGPGQIFGVRTAALEVLTSFASSFDFALAGKQCLVLTLIVLLVTSPVAMLVGRHLATGVLAKQFALRGPMMPPRAAGLIAAAMACVATLAVFVPLAGLCLPALRQPELSRALDEVRRTVVNTVVYSVGAGLMAAALGLVVALAVGRFWRLTAVVIGACFVVFALPPALYALGCARIGALAPAWFDPLLRSRITICMVLSLRLFPIAVLLLARAYQSLPVTWNFAAAVHGVPWPRYARRVVLPHLATAVATSILLVALAALADVGTVLLLHPPGESSLPLAIFTVMANAPESLVASLCLVYLAVAAAALASVCQLAKRVRR